MNELFGKLQLSDNYWGQFPHILSVFIPPKFQFTSAFFLINYIFINYFQSFYLQKQKVVNDFVLSYFQPQNKTLLKNISQLSYKKKIFKTFEHYTIFNFVYILLFKEEYEG